MLNAVAMAVVGGALLSGLLYLQQPSMIFFPRSNLDATPADWGLEYETVDFSASDGVALHGWYIPREGATRVVLFLHGNAGNISHRGESVRIFHDLGLSVLIFDYRGYGLSAGRPTESGLYLDADAAWAYLVGERGVDSRDIVIFGRSLGGVVAARLASVVKPGAVIVESAFTSARDVARAVFPLLARITVLRYEFPASDYLGRANAPVLVLHSRDDEIMPFELGERLYEAASEPKSFVEMRGDHNTGFLLSQPEYARALQQFLADELTNREGGG
jgi:fermentation-respiration switch protein FrsA (DUF1100 family)